MWINRLINIKKKVTDSGAKFEGNLAIRAMISATIDSDSSSYVIVSFSAVSFLFLGGIQLDYHKTLLAMIVSYSVSSLGDSLRVYLAYKQANSLQDVVHTSAIMQSNLHNVSADLKPSNVYEDLGRGKAIILMTFATQCILISFVVRFFLTVSRANIFFISINLSCSVLISMTATQPHVEMAVHLAPLVER
jgi:hypothetical protein